VIGQEQRNKLVEIVAVILDVEPALVTDELSPQQLDQWDSMNHVNICMAVSQEFNVELTADEIRSVEKVGDLVRLLSAKGAS
jgi:acyl carrier protein